MEQNISLDISNFFIAGISYKKADASTRGHFAVDPIQYEHILEQAPVFNLESLFILSTCNRTEIYGFAENAAQLINLLCTQTKGPASTFTQLAYVKSGLDAVEHLFDVGAGLDSQILGDYEIVGQLKQSVKFSKERGFINGFLERLINTVLHVSKIIKNETALSAGTVSVSFAAVQYIKEHIPYGQDKKILVLGAGKIGRITCKNLIDYLCASRIIVINRSEKNAAGLASDLGLNYAPMSQLANYLASSDIILTCTNADKPIIMRSHLENKGNKLLIDLSVPAM
ncbi:MAG TPA: NAD(P)-binding domain-containing protein [Mucilaginibacter sp.]|jgi:glutamyl-tRNA reductase